MTVCEQLVTSYWLEYMTVCEQLVTSYWLEYMTVYEQLVMGPNPRKDKGGAKDVRS